MIKFGPSGNDEGFYAAGYKHSEQSATYVKEKGLDCFEYSFGRGVNMGAEKACSIGRAFAEAGVEISVHAPYFINFANPDEEMVEKSYGYVLDSARALKLLGGKRLVFHPAAQGKATWDDAVTLCEDRLKILRDKIYESNLQDVMFCPETMGKIAQIGGIEEITRFCMIDKIYTPCVDFGHVNARERGTLKTVEDYKSRLEYMIEKLGKERMDPFHVHFSKIMYGARGEIKHLTFEDTVYGPEFEPLAVALKELDLHPYIVSESAGTQSEDALTMKNIYQRIDR
jgi:deoxyribonuclease-4